MKKLYLLFLLACALLGSAPAHAQLSGSDSLQAKRTSIFVHLDKSQIPTGYRYEAGIYIIA